MKRTAVTVVFIALFLSANAISAVALPPFQKPWLEKYAGETATPEFKSSTHQARCAVCHVLGAPKMPKDGMYNDYGKAVRKFVKKRDYREVKDDAERLQQLIDEVLQKAELETSPKGKTFRERFRDGYLD